MRMPSRLLPACGVMVHVAEMLGLNPRLLLLTAGLTALNDGGVTVATAPALAETIFAIVAASMPPVCSMPPAAATSGLARAAATEPRKSCEPAALALSFVIAAASAA